MMKVSIIVPIYNAERYLGVCIESILAQSYSNIEAILVNDGSTDRSLSICESYARKDDRIRIINKANSGVSDTRNVGIEAATGEYVCFSDADDYLMPDYIEYLLKLCKQYDADIAYSSEMFTTFHKDQLEQDEVKVLTPELATEAILLYNVPVGVYSKMFRREFLLSKHVRFYSHIFIGEGFNFNTYAFQRANKVVAGKHKIYFYRRDNNESAMTHFNVRKCTMAIQAIEQIRKDLIVKTQKVKLALDYADWHTHCDMFIWMENAHVAYLYPDVYKQCLSYGRRKALIAFQVNGIRTIERLKSPFMIFFPKLLAKLMDIRNKKAMRVSTNRHGGGSAFSCSIAYHCVYQIPMPYRVCA